ncbi:MULTISPECIES: hypothetical protein [unclassified Pseudomonas]|uniref:hypothetical protein n=1 Tax=unclassified Pseudomonas TaxID=196821 RepID=UPI00191EBA32|nr:MULTISPECIES: hypothetical protein [unclassified Pseudomonas]MBL0794914.1 hypothetical protein [Pseudomonas sp. B7]
MSIEVVINKAINNSTNSYEEVILPPKKAELFMNIGDEMLFSDGTNHRIYRKMYTQVNDQFDFKISVWTAILL